MISLDTLRLSALLTCAVGSGYVTSTAAAEWSVEPTVSVGTEANTNRRLDAVEPKESIGGIVDAGAVFGMRTEQTDVRLTPRGRISRYIGDGTLGADNAFLDFSASHRRDDRSSFGLDASFARDSSLVTELQTTGRVQDNKTVYSYQLSPNFSYQINEQNSVQANLGYQDVSYVDGLRVGLIDYTYKTAGLSYTHAFNETASGFVLFSAAQFDVPDLASMDNTYSAQLGYSRGFSKTLNATARGGLIYGESRFRLLGQKFTESTIGELFDFSIDKSYEKTRFSAKIQRTVTPSSQGSQLTRDNLELGALYRFSEYLDSRVVYTHITTATQQGRLFGLSAPDYNYDQVDTEVRYKLNQWWSLVGSYKFTHAGSSIFADDHAVTLSLSYGGNKHTLPR